MDFQFGTLEKSWSSCLGALVELQSPRTRAEALVQGCGEVWSRVGARVQGSDGVQRSGMEILLRKTIDITNGKPRFPVHTLYSGDTAPVQGSGLELELLSSVLELELQFLEQSWSSCPGLWRTSCPRLRSRARALAQGSAGAPVPE